MSLRLLVRLGGWALLAGGILQAVGTALHPNDTGATRYLYSPLWAPAHVILACSFLLLVFGVPSLYLPRHAKLGLVGLIGFVGAEVGNVLLVGVTLSEAFLLPALAVGGPAQPLVDWLQPSGPLAGAAVVSALALLGYTYGYVLLGLAVWRARGPSSPGAVLVIAGALLSNGELFGSVGFTAYLIGGLLLGDGLCLLGRTIVQSSMAEVAE